MSTRFMQLTGHSDGAPISIRCGAVQAVADAPGFTAVYVAAQAEPFAVAEDRTAVLAMVEISAEDAAREARGAGPLNGPGRR